jgi:uncharacterized protein YodC (DUF2158 family)
MPSMLESNAKNLEATMSTKKAATTIGAMLGALSAQWPVPALAGRVQSNPLIQTHATPVLQIGDVVRLRSGGPLLTVKSVQGNQVICSWWSEEIGGFETTGFPIAMLTGPVPLPPNDPNLQKGETGE